MADTTTITPMGPFSLAASTRFLEDFTPAGYGGGEHLHLAFWVEGDGGIAGACVRQPMGEADDADAADAVVVQVQGDADPERAVAQVTRILSLDVDGTGWPAVGDRDPVIGELQRRSAGLRPVTFWSAYEAAAWSVLSTRVRMAQAAALKQNIAAALGTVVDIHGDTVVAFPSPAVLASALREPAPLRGLTERKATYLAGIAEAAADGRLDSPALRGRRREEALADLQELAGIGPFGAELVLLRGAGDPDGFPGQERRLAQAMAQRYGLVDPEVEELTAIAERWRPYRTRSSASSRSSPARPSIAAPSPRRRPHRRDRELHRRLERPLRPILLDQAPGPSTWTKTADDILVSARPKITTTSATATSEEPLFSCCS